MSSNLIQQPYTVMLDPNGGGGRAKPIAQGYFWYGQIDHDPKLTPIDVFYKDESGTEVKLIQPLRTNSSGAFIDASNGKLIQPYTRLLGYSVLIMDKSQSKVIYTDENVGDPGNVSSAINAGDSQIAGKTWPTVSTESAKDGDDLTGYDNVRLMLNGVLTLFPIKKKDGSRTELIGNLTNINTTTKPYSATVGSDDVWLLDKRFYGSPVMGVTPELTWCEGHSADSLRDPSVTLIDNIVTLQAAADFARNSNLSLNLSDVFYYTSGTVYFGDLKVRADVAGWTDPYYARRPDGTNFIDGSNSANWNYFYNADDSGRNTTWRKHLESARYGAAIISDTASPIVSCNSGEKFNSNGFGIIGNHRLQGQDGLAYPLTQKYDGNAHDINFLRVTGCGNHGIALYNGYETSVTKGLRLDACNGNGFFAGVVNGGAIDSAMDYLRFKDSGANHCRLGGFYFEHVRTDIVFDNVNGNNSGQYDGSSVKVDPLLGYDRTIPTTRKDMKSLIWINDACLDSIGDQGAMHNIEFNQVWGEQIAVLVHVRSQFMNGIARNIRFNNLRATRVDALAGKAKDDPSNGVAIFLDIKYLEDMKVANVYEQALAMIDVENVTAATESIDIFGYTPITAKEFAILRNRYGGFSKDERHASRTPVQFKDFPAQPADHVVITDVIKGAHSYTPAQNEMPHAAKWRLTGAHGITDTDRWAIYEITVMRTNLGKYHSSVHEIVNTGSFTAAPTLDYDTGDLSVPMREYSLLSVELLDPYEWIGSGF